MGSETSDGFPYPLPTDCADLAGQLEALARIDQEIFCLDPIAEGVNTLSDLGRLWCPPGFTYTNSAILTATTNAGLNISCPTRVYDNLHRNTEVQGPFNWNLPTGPESGRTPSWFMIGAQVTATTAALTAGSLRQIEIHLDTFDPFTLSTTSRILSVINYGILTNTSLVINEFVLAYSGTFFVQFTSSNVANMSVAVGAARVWVQKLWPASGPQRLS